MTPGDPECTEQPPRTFAQWSVCFERMTAGRLDAEAAAALCCGTLEPLSALPRFLERLEKAENAFLKKKLNAFEKQLNLLLEAGEPEGLAGLLARQKREWGLCLFYKKLAFIPEETRNELCRETGKQVRAYLAGLRAHLRAQCRESGGDWLEDSVLQLDRLGLSELFDVLDGSADG